MGKSAHPESRIPKRLCTCIAIIAALALVFSAFACGSTATQTPVPAVRPPSGSTLAPTSAPGPISSLVIINNPEELVLSIEDFPVGWMVGVKGQKKGGYEISFAKARAGAISVVLEGAVVSWIRVYPTEELAKVEFDTRKQRATGTFAMGTPYLKSESYWYQVPGTHQVSFRIQNVLSELIIVDQYGLSGLDPKQTARKQEAKINSVKRLGAEATALPPQTPIISPTPSATFIPAATLIPTPTTPPTLVPTATPTLIPAPIPRPTITPTPDPAASLRLAFTSNRDGNPEIYTISALGTGLRRLTYAEALDWAPTWSPDGGRIAFLTARDGGQHLFLMDADGANQRRLFADHVGGRPPSWAPDGRTIAVETFGDGRSTITLISVDGSTPRQLTSGAVSEWCPRWSLDGSRIGFLRDGELYVMNPDGSNRLRLTTSRASGECPSWSPDSKRIAFVMDFHLYVVNRDGSGLAKLEQIHTPVFHPSWSPDGRSIAFKCAQWVCTIKSDGTDFRQVSQREDDWSNPAWSPDGNFIAVVCLPNPRGLCVIRLDATYSTRLSDAVNDYAWSPVKSRP